MRFKMYQIVYMKREATTEETQQFRELSALNHNELFEQLNKLPIIKEEDGSGYTVLYCKDEAHIILGTFIQSYSLALTKFAGETKNEVPLSENEANDKTFFFIDTMKGQIYIQNKRYESDRLSRKKTFDRLEYLVEELLKTEYEYIIKFVDRPIEYTVDELIEIFQNNYVKQVEFRHMLGIQIPQGTKLHNPREHLDQSLAETWNTYCINEIDYMELKSSKDGESLNKNPFAKIGMTLSKEAENSKEVINKITIVDSEGEEVLRPKDNEHKIINISRKKQKDPFETYEVILKKTLKGYRGR